MQQWLLHEGLLHEAKHHPEKTALVLAGKSYSYGQLRDTARRLAAALKAHGLARGDRVAVYMENSWPCVVSIYGALLAGCVFVAINPQTKTHKLKTILHDCGASALLTDTLLAPSFLPAIEKHSHLHLIAVTGNLSDRIRSWVGAKSFDAVIAQSKPLKEPVAAIPNDLAALIYTSGSTGTPKGVMQTHLAMVFASWSLTTYLRLSADDKILLILPMAFDYGLYQLLLTIRLGATLIIEKSFAFPVEIYERIATEEITVFPGVPTIFARMIAMHEKKKLCFPSVTRVTNTAAALPVDFLPVLREIFPNALIYKMYGLTECKRVCYLEPELLETKAASVGKAIPGTEIFLQTPEGKPVPPGEPGILHVRGPHIMAGYWRQPELSKKMLKPGPVPGEQILCTGDIFTKDKDGFFSFIGRTDDIIKTRGEKVSPLEVELVLYNMEGIEEAAVVGVPDREQGEAIYAFVVTRNRQKITERYIKKKCLTQLEFFMVPQKIFFLLQLPKTANNKIDKKKLLTELTEED